jgi:Lar family restriction alleviation protein
MGKREASLRPCPFCGRAEVEVTEDGSDEWTVVRCRPCGALGPAFGSHRRYRRHLAVKAWNRRAGLSAFK